MGSSGLCGECFTHQITPLAQGFDFYFLFLFLPTLACLCKIMKHVLAWLFSHLIFFSTLYFTELPGFDAFLISQWASRRQIFPFMPYIRNSGRTEASSHPHCTVELGKETHMRLLVCYRSQMNVRFQKGEPSTGGLRPRLYVSGSRTGSQECDRGRKGPH